MILDNPDYPKNPYLLFVYSIQYILLIYLDKYEKIIFSKHTLFGL